MIFNKNLDDINYSDIKNLINEKTPESRYLDYKSELHLSKESEKKEFLADIISFANAEGGFIIYGIRAENGIPVEINGISIPNLDEFLLRVEQIIRNGIEPVIIGKSNEEISIKNIEISNNTYILLIKIPKSIYSPHRVKNTGKFFKRGERGKYEMPYEELKMAFLNSETVNMDKKLFEKFLNFLPSDNPSIIFVKEHNFSFPFNENLLKLLEEFLRTWNNAEYEFFDEDLERLKEQLYSLIKEFLLLLSENVFPLGNSNKFLSVPSEWELEQPERFHKVVSKLHELGDKIYQTHQELIRIGRKKLKV
ncbi:MAG: hypothetical protein DSY60_05590 [Persephonella sp.]|nr:MAG: hypothetical protein DSY60_05590 [Persephonella sp.]